MQYLSKSTRCSLVIFTCNESVFDAEAESFKLLITGELNPHEASSGGDQARVLPPAEPIDERREPKRAIADLNVIKAALKGRLNVVVLIEGQLDPLSGQSFGVET